MSGSSKLTVDDGRSVTPATPPPAQREPIAVEGESGEDQWTSHDHAVHSIVTGARELPKQHLVALTDQLFISMEQLFGSRPKTIWYLPDVKKVPAGSTEGRWGAAFIPGKYHTHRTLELRLNGMVMNMDLVNYALRVFLLVTVWFALWNVLPRHLDNPRGDIFQPAKIIITSALFGGFICRVFLKVPPLIGMLWCGIFWRNIPGGQADDLNSDFVVVVRKCALLIVLLRTGFAFKLAAVKKIAVNAVTMGMFPFVAEATGNAILANHLFELGSYTWAFLLGFLVAALAPATIVPNIMYLQSKGRSTKDGPSFLMLSALSIETGLVIWCINFMNSLVDPGNDRTLALSIALGPIQIIGGLLGGFIVGYAVVRVADLVRNEEHPTHRDGRHRTQHLRYVHKVTLGTMIGLAAALLFYSYRVKLTPGGSIFVMAMSTTVGNVWSRRVEAGDKNIAEHMKLMNFALAKIWDRLVVPFLFSLIGASIDLSEIFAGDFLSKAVPCMVVGVASRMIVSCICCINSGLSKGEIFVASFGLLGKAAVQAALGGIVVENAINATPVNPNDVRRAKIVKNCAFLAIATIGPIATATLKIAGLRVFRIDKSDPAVELTSIASPAQVPAIVDSNSGRSGFTPGVSPAYNNPRTSLSPISPTSRSPTAAGLEPK